MVTLKDKKLKSIITTNIDFDSEEAFSIKGQIIFLKKDVKEAVSNYKLWCNIVDEREKYYTDKIWNDICTLEYMFKNRLLYLMNEYDLRLDVDNKEDGFEKIFGDFEK